MKFSTPLTLLLFAISSSAFGTDSSIESAQYDAQYTLANSNGSANYSLTTDAQNSNTSIEINGVTVDVGITAWSNSAGSADNKLSQGNIQGWWNCSLGDNGCTSANRHVGYGIKNSDYSWGGDSHAVDNSGDGGGRDFDMFLLSFSESVTLESASFTWVVGDNDNKEVTVAGLNSIAAFDGGASSTWNTVTSAIVENTLGHYGVGSKGSNGLYESTFTKLTGSAKYWLIGAYNTIFDDAATGHFDSVQLKLSSLGVSMIQQTPTTQVSEPGALALMSLGLGLVLYRRKRRV
mgnify:CR=1 FL=1